MRDCWTNAGSAERVRFVHRCRIVYRRRVVLIGVVIGRIMYQLTRREVIVDAYEASKREQVVCRGIFKLRDALYAATQRRPPDDELAELIERAKQTQRDFEAFLDDLGAGMKKNIVASYGSEMADVAKYLAAIESAA